MYSVWLRCFTFTDTPYYGCTFLKADGSRERSEPWSEGGGYYQLCWLYIPTTPERKEVERQGGAKAAMPPKHIPRRQSGRRSGCVASLFLKQPWTEELTLPVLGLGLRLPPCGRFPILLSCRMVTPASKKACPLLNEITALFLNAIYSVLP